MDDHSITIEENSERCISKVVKSKPKSEPCISKVHVGLRNVKPEAYEPVLVSIGPYHKANPDLQAMQQKAKCDLQAIQQKGKPDLQAMQQIKELYLNSLLERRNKRLKRIKKSPESREIYLAKLKKYDSEARNCYVDPVNSNIADFAEMILLDGCFIVEFLRKMNYVPSNKKDAKSNPKRHDDDDVKVKFNKDDPVKRVPWMKSQILSDMMLLENQLPYFVLSKVYKMTTYDGEKPLEEMVLSCFNDMLPRPRLNSNNAFGNIGEINHLLHLIHVFCRPFPEKTHPSPKKTIKSNEGSNNGSEKNRGIEESSGGQTSPLLHRNNDSGSVKNWGREGSSDESDSDESNVMKIQMGTVVELQEAGVKFEKLGKIYNGAALNKKTEEKGDDYVSLFDIEFKRGVPCFKYGVMNVPCFQVDDTTETLLRNLIAYEQHFPKHFSNGRPTYFTDFACLMNQLINSKEDAKVLRFEKIIMNFLGDDDELSELFNRLTNSVCESPKPYYHKVRQEVDKHCKENWNTWMANLNHKYFNNPWAGLSTGAAVLLLLLTVGQFVVAVLTL